jgi:parallel beta-helix repeat protein
MHLTLSDFSLNHELRTTRKIYQLGERSSIVERGNLFRRTFSALMIALLFVSIITLAFNVQLAKADPEAISINADGTITPPYAPLSSSDHITYTFTGNIGLPNYTGIVVARSGIVLNGNGYWLQGNSSDGVWIENNNVTVENLQVSGFTYGIQGTANVTNSHITGDTIGGNVAGISLTGTCTIQGNTIFNNKDDGIMVQPSSSGSNITGNVITGNGENGIDVLGSTSSNTISANILSTNGRAGVSLWNTISNTVTNNEIEGNLAGVEIGMNSQGNEIFHNNFVNNTNQVTIDPNPPSSNAWDSGYPSGGNYWSNYNGRDFFTGPYQNLTGSDGIGDTPYTIYSNNADHYPLMKPWNSSTPTWTKITLSVSLVSAGSAVTCTATVLGSSPTGIITWSTSSSTGNFSPPNSTLSSGSCSTTYTDSRPGSETIAASYSGNSNNQPSGGSASLTVVSSGPVLYSQNYASVQAAIDAATNGSNIIVAAGNHYEFLTLNKTLTIVGDPPNPPVFGGGGSGIYLTLLSGASGSIVTGFEITSYDEGILDYAGDCKIYGNTMNSMGEEGIVLEGSSATGNVIYDNSFQDTPAPISLTASAAGNTIYDNIINSQAAVTLSVGANGNSVYQNVISGNSIVLNMTNSQGNVLYHNDFLATVEIVLAGTNTWDNGSTSEGNYWSDYQTKYPGATQIDSSGIWNTPYAIDSNNKDNYPLMNPYALAVGHDVAITDLVTTKVVIMQGFSGNITLNAFDEGQYPETFSTIAYATAAGTTNSIVVGTQQVSLNSMNQITLTFVWNTAGLAKGNYTLSAYANPVSGETDLSANNFIGGQIVVSMVGDLTGAGYFVPDGKCDIKDIAAVARCFGSTPGSPTWNANCDVNNDGKVDIKDIAIVAKHFGQVDP